MRAGAVYFQGVETPRPLKNAQKGSHTKTTTTRRHKETGRHRSGLRRSMTEEGRRTGLEARTPSGPEGPGPRLRPAGGGGGWFENWQRKDITKKG